MISLVARKYTTDEMLEITSKLIEKEEELWKKESSFWTGGEKDACRVRKKYYNQLLTVLNARKSQESNQGQLFGL